MALGDAMARTGGFTQGELRKKDRKWLELASHSGGMYPGIQCDMVPSGPTNRLRKAGFIQLYMPHNGAHKDRWQITPEGRAALNR